MKKSILLALVITVMLSTVSFAFSKTPYGDEFYVYGKKLMLQGDFTASEIAINSDGSFPKRYSYLVKTDMNVRNIITGQTEYIPEMMAFNIEEKDDMEDFTDRNGYLLVPMRDDVIREWVNRFNGNPSYVATQLLTSSYPDFESARYTVDGDSANRWVNLATVLLYSGGGGETPTRVSRNDWGKYPTSDFDFNRKALSNNIKITNFPEIRDFSLDSGTTLASNSKLTFDFSTYSVYNKQAVAYLYVNDDPSGWEVSNLSSFDSGTEIKVQKQGPITDYNGLLSRLDVGENKLKLAVRDYYYRLTENEITVQYMPAAPNLKVSDVWYSPSPVKPGDNVNVSVLVTNEHNEAITTEFAQWVNNNQVEVKAITVNPNSSMRVAGKSFTAPNTASIPVKFVVNPNRNKPNTEREWADNEVSRNIPINQSLNLYISFSRVPAKVGSLDKYDVRVIVTNTGNLEVNTTLDFTNEYKWSYQDCDLLGNCVWRTETEYQNSDVNLSLNPKAVKTIPIDNIQAGWDYYDIGVNEYYVTISAEVNKNRNVQESSYTDNVVSQKVYINPLPYVPKRGVLIE
jgi:hypothetical protein